MRTLPAAHVLKDFPDDSSIASSPSLFPSDSFVKSSSRAISCSAPCTGSTAKVGAGQSLCNLQLQTDSVWAACQEPARGVLCTAVAPSVTHWSDRMCSTFSDFVFTRPAMMYHVCMPQHRIILVIDKPRSSMYVWRYRPVAPVSRCNARPNSTLSPIFAYHARIGAGFRLRSRQFSGDHNQPYYSRA